MGTTVPRETAEFLFNILDDIDTASDMAKNDDRAFRRIVERLHRKRFEVAITDGYTLTFRSDPGFDAAFAKLPSTLANGTSAS